MPPAPPQTVKSAAVKENRVGDQSSLDIIIVNYNSTDCLIRCLASVYQDLDGGHAEIYVADNDSKDDVDKIIHVFPDVHLIKNRRNIGFASAVNQCIRISASPYLLLLNPDTVISPGFFKKMMGFMETRGDAGIIGPAIFDHDMKIQGSARSFPTPMTAFFGRSAVLTRLFPDNRISRKNMVNKMCDGKTPLPVDWVSGACMLVRRAAVEAVGLMDPNFFMYWEDADWCRRMRENGWEVLYYPQASLVHFAGMSSEQNLIQSVVAFHQSALYLYDKYAKAYAVAARPLVMMGLGARVCILLLLHGIRRRFFKVQ